MLNRLLELLQQGGTRRVRNLADQLDTTPELVEAMLEDLARMGYLTRVGAECSNRCGACPLADMCVAGGSPRQDSSRKKPAVWVLTDKQRPAE